MVVEEACSETPRPQHTAAVACTLPMSSPCLSTLHSLQPLHRVLEVVGSQGPGGHHDRGRPRPAAAATATSSAAAPPTAARCPHQLHLRRGRAGRQGWRCASGPLPSYIEPLSALLAGPISPMWHITWSRAKHSVSLSAGARVALHVIPQAYHKTDARPITQPLGKRSVSHCEGARSPTCSPSLDIHMPHDTCSPFMYLRLNQSCQGAPVRRLCQGGVVGNLWGGERCGVVLWSGTFVHTPCNSHTPTHLKRALRRRAPHAAQRHAAAARRHHGQEGVDGVARPEAQLGAQLGLGFWQLAGVGLMGKSEGATR